MLPSFTLGDGDSDRKDLAADFETGKSPQINFQFPGFNGGEERNPHTPKTRRKAIISLSAHFAQSIDSLSGSVKK